MGKDIQKNVVINGRTTAGFNSLAGKIKTIGGEIEAIGKKVYEWEKQSVEVYRNYQDNMLDAQGALKAQYKNASDLTRVMNQLDTQARKWAESSIFHTDDVSAAIAQAAHAGWDLEKMLQGIPQAMLLAQAGGLDLSTGLNYLVKGLNATGTEFSDAGKFLDQWTMAANRSATNIDEIGEALLSMGTSAHFANNTAELFTMLATLADVGTVGAHAGTLLRSSMIRLVAPTKKARDAMDQLNVTEEEYAEITGDLANLEEVNALLEESGFSAYDSQGNLKGFLQIYKDLYSATSGMTEEQRNTVLSSIFPTRSIATAMALLEGASHDFGGLYAELLSDSSGYTQSVSDIMMSGLTGSIELFVSKYEELQNKVGKSLEGPVTSLLETLGGFLTGLNDLPEEQFNALVGGITGIAAAGAGAAAATALIAALTALGGTGAGIILAAAGVGSLVSYLTTLSENQFKGNFGTLEVDIQTLETYVDSINSKISGEASSIQTWANAVDAAQTSYTSLITAFSEQLLTEAVTDDLTETDIQQLTSKGEKIIQALQDGVQNGKARDMTLLQTLFGDSSDQKNAYQNGANWTAAYYDDLYEEAYTIGENIKDNLTAALQNGELTPNDRAAIQAQLDRLNQIEAEIANGRARETLYAQMYAAGRVSWDSASAFLAGNAEKQASALATVDEFYASSYGRYRNAWESAHAKGDKFTYTGPDGKTYTVDASESAWTEFEKQFRGEHEAARQSEIDKYGAIQMSMLDALMSDSSAANAWRAAKFISESGGFENTDWGLLGALLGGADFVGELSTLGSILPRLESVFGESGKTGPIGDMLTLLHAMYAGNENPTMQLEMAEDDGSIAAAQDRAQQYLTEHPGSWPVNPIIGSPETSGEPLDTYAAGGRATSASIFGEAGAEWAIPEEHSDRTAELLNAARQASGFSWGELINRNGGLNGGASESGITLTYAPTINASSTEGIDAILANDKQRLRAVIDRLLRDRDMRVRAEVYA